MHNKQEMMESKTKEHGAAAFNEAVTSATTTEAKAMLSAFASVGATHFDVTLKNEQTGEICFDRHRTANGLSLSLTCLLYQAERDGLDIIVRPLAKTPLIQLDDLAASSVERVRAFAFVVIETSRTNFQAWLAVTDADETTARRLRAATGADLHASGAVRLCGTVNHKKEHAPDIPTVRLIEAQPGHTTTAAELEAHELLLETAPTTLTPPRVPSLPRFSSQTFPDYGRCLNNAPERHGGAGKDISRADWHFALIAADRGFNAEDIATELMSLSEKAKQDGIRYADRTARRAVESVQARKVEQSS